MERNAVTVTMTSGGLAPADVPAAQQEVHDMAEYPAEIERKVRALDGTVVQLRPIRPDDDARLVAFHSRLSSYSVYLRFFGFHPTLSDSEVRRFTRVDYHDRLALVVVREGRLLAVGRYDRMDGTDEAEVAFVVDDEVQHQGLGSLLLDELAKAAWGRGLRRFVAHTLAQNASMLHVFWRAGFPVTTDFDAGSVRVRFPIDPVPSFRSALALRETSRRVAPSDHAGTAYDDGHAPAGGPRGTGTSGPAAPPGQMAPAPAPSAEAAAGRVADGEAGTSARAARPAGDVEPPPGLGPMTRPRP